MRFTYSQYLTAFRDYSQNDDISESVIKRYLNTGAGMLFSRMKRHIVHKTKETILVPNQAFYHFPIDALRLVSLKVLIGAQTYSMRQVESQVEWDLVTSDTNLTSDQPTYFRVANNVVELFPTPSAANRIIFTYEKVYREIGAADYTAGNVTDIAANSAVVEGQGTSWSSNVKAGQFFRVDGDTFWYEIKSVDSDTQITLVQDFEGTPITSATEAYTIGDMFPLPDDLQEGPTAYAVMRYFRSNRRDPQMAAEWETEYNRILSIADGRYSHQTQSKIQNLRDPRFVVSANSFPNIPA